MTETGSSENLPIIDIGPFIRQEPGAAAVVSAIETAGRQTGFMLITGHEVSAQITIQLYDLARVFFDHPEDWKRQYENRGLVKGGASYAPLASEALSATLGQKTPGDYKESLDYGSQLMGNVWPQEPEGIEASYRAYFKEMEKLAHHLRRAFSLAAGLAPDHFEPAFEGHLSALRVINYPDQKVAPIPGQVRAGEHTDYGFMTILRSEASSGGLQVRQRNGQWLDVPAINGAYVVNIGDAFMRWTNDEWVSTPHRVINPPQTVAGTARRQSIPFFVNPNSETLIECLAPFCTNGKGAKYPPITYGDYIALKTKEAFGGKNNAPKN